MKRLYLAVGLLMAFNASAHGLWPESYDVAKGEDETMINMHLLDRNEDANYLISVNGLSTGDEQFVFANEVADFPIIIQNKDLINDTAKICAMKDDDSKFKKEVCVIVKAE